MTSAAPRLILGVDIDLAGALALLGPAADLIDVADITYRPREATMTEAERRAFNAGIETARDVVLEAAAMTWLTVSDAPVVEPVTLALGTVVDQLAMLLRPEPASPEARRRAFALVQA